MSLKVGSLVRWVSSHRSYEANGDILVGLEPIYKYGVVLEASKKSEKHFVVAACDDMRWHVINTEFDSVEVLSEGKDG